MTTMQEDQRDILTSEPTPPTKSGWGCGRGCLFIFIGLLLVAVVAVVILGIYHRNLIAMGVRPIVKGVVEQLPLPPDEIADARVVTSDLVDAWVDGALDFGGLAQSMITLKSSPPVVALTLSLLEYDDMDDWKIADATASASSPLGQSMLSGEEKTRFTAASRQFVAALAAGMIPVETMDSFWTTLTPHGGQPSPGRSGLASQVTDSQLRALLSIMDSATQGKEIPPASEIDPHDGLRAVMGKLKEVRDRATGATP